MNRPVLVCALLIATAAVLGAQEASQSSPYQGTANPPADDEILTSSPSEAKPPAGNRGYTQPTDAIPAQAEPRPSSVDPAINFPSPDSDDGIVQVARPARAASQPALTARAYDPDGDIVHPHPLRPGELAEGTSIRVRLLNRLSSAGSEKGETFRTKVASDVMQGGQVLIPAGAEIDGSVVEVSGGHFGGHGTMRLRPDTVILPGGVRYRLHAYLTSTPGAKTRVGGEGAIDPGSRAKRDTVEYGGAVGAGATTGAILGGPVGALTGGLIGAGVVTAHLLISHPQATLETGTVIVFTLSEPLSMVPASRSDE